MLTAAAGPVRIGIAGAGGLGSNVAMHLLRSGLRELRIVDCDRVQVPNLNRQFYFADQVGRLKVAALRDNLRRIDPGFSGEMLAARVTADNVHRLFCACAVVVEAFDGAADKAMLVEALAPTGILVVAGSGLGGVGGCNAIVTRRVGASFILVGDGLSDARDYPPLSPRVGVCAAAMADAVLAQVRAGAAKFDGGHKPMYAALRSGG